MFYRNSKYISLHSVAILCGFAFFTAVAATQTASSSAASMSPGAEAHPILVELFTSEGCSSCPPADEFIQKLDTLQPVHGAQLIVLSEHVDYWDGDGWKDPNSSHALTQRQADYVRALGLSTAYTPQIIVDGTKEARISDSKQLQDVFQQAAATSKIPIRLSTVAVNQGKPGLISAHIETDTADHSADVFLVVALSHVESQVLHGENGGRHLTHVAVVQQLAKVGKLQKGKSFAQDVHVQLKTAPDPGNIRVVAFAQTSGPGKLLGAALWKAVP